MEQLENAISTKVCRPDKTLFRIGIPKDIIRAWGWEFVRVVYEDRVVFYPKVKHPDLYFETKRK